MWISFIQEQEYMLVSRKGYVHWNKGHCVWKKHILHVQKTIH